MAQLSRQTIKWGIFFFKPAKTLLPCPNNPFWITTKAPFSTASFQFRRCNFFGVFKVVAFLFFAKCRSSERPRVSKLGQIVQPSDNSARHHCDQTCVWRNMPKSLPKPCTQRITSLHQRSEHRTQFVPETRKILHGTQSKKGWSPPNRFSNKHNHKRCF